eukprot:TRINITY_DN16079_c0_g1_i1.p1 TRINITY_DN16079_c0_g1~~TRINITY_DN16079_c0_g1_i1.p1  ORF type:complete len:381 (-),score=75.75 TRINITY_DN16079_c0_g1_i1:207-1349(-)
MPVGQWAASGLGSMEPWDQPRVVSRDVSTEAFMEELCRNVGGYRRFFWLLIRHYLAWWAGMIIVPAVFMDHHRCETKLPLLAWLLYTGTLFAMLAMAILMELSVVQRLGLLRPGDLAAVFSDPRLQLPLVDAVLWKMDAYTDVVFIFIARDCGSSLWWASLATFGFGVVCGQLFFNTCFACTDCDRELPSSFGFMLLDFKLVNAAIRQALPFDPDASDLPVARPVTLRTVANLNGFEKVVCDVAQVSIQGLFLHNSKAPQTFVAFSILCGTLHGTLSLVQSVRACMQDEWAAQAQSVQMGTALLPSAMLSSTAHSMQLDAFPKEEGRALRAPERLKPMPATEYGKSSYASTSNGTPPLASAATNGQHGRGRSSGDAALLL